MDPFIAMILKQSGAIALVAAAGVLVALIYGAIKYTQLQHALTLNTLPASFP